MLCHFLPLKKAPKATKITATRQKSFSFFYNSRSNYRILVLPQQRREL